MTSSELIAIALAAYGPNWPAKLAELLDVDTATVRRWTSGAIPVPQSVQSALANEFDLEDRPARLWPRDEWISQIETGKRSYIVHTLTPRFIARLVECDDTGLPLASEGDVDALTGIVYADQDLLVCEIAWIDPEPPENDLASLLDQALEAFHDFPEAS